LLRQQQRQVTHEFDEFLVGLALLEGETGEGMQMPFRERRCQRDRRQDGERPPGEAPAHNGVLEQPVEAMTPSGVQHQGQDDGGHGHHQRPIPQDAR
jgi:hypothetical protein